MRCLNRAGLAAGALVAMVVLAGCGASNGTLLTSSAATQLTFELNQAASALDAYNCQVADTALTNFSDDVHQLDGVNATLTRMLSQGASKITALASQRCPTGSGSPTTATTASTTTATTGTATVTTGTTTSTSVTATSPVSTPTSLTSTGSGGAAPTTASTPSVPITPADSTPATTTTPSDSGGAGLSSSGDSSGAAGPASGSAQ
jgi:hypothetical protein